MKKIISFLGIVLIVGSFIILAARWFHPATFNEIYIILSMTLGIILLAANLLIEEFYGRKN
jgi:hypothetical protein